MSEIEKPSAGKVGVLTLVGFTLTLAIIGTLVRIGFAMTERGASTIAEGTAPLYLLFEGLIASFPVAVTVCLGY